MKIRTINHRIILSKVRRLAVFGGMMLMAIVVGNDASAQTGGLLKYLSTAPGSAQRSTANTKQTQIKNLGQDYRVVSSANVRTAADTQSSGRRSQSSRRQTIGVRPPAVQTAGSMRGPIGAALASQENSVQQTSYGCQSCGNSCGGACGGYGYTAGSVGHYGGSFACGVPCDPYYFVIGEALFMERGGDDSFTLSQNYRLDGFDFEWGSRVTIGAVPDCVHGCEITLTGPMDWDMSGSLTNPAGGLNSFLIPGNPVAAGDMTGFFNATGQSQTYTADYWSLEANKTLIGWDVAKVMYGARYVDYDEKYSFLSQSLSGDTGSLQSDVNNQLFGFQVGFDLLYPVRRFTYFDVRGRMGGFLNFADSDVRYNNAGTTSITNFADDEEIAGIFEFGSGLRYQLGDSLSLRAGGEIWYFAGLATANDQIDQVVTPNMGRRIRMDDDVFFYGVNFSAELRY